jgi:hypothetical protein
MRDPLTSGLAAPMPLRVSPYQCRQLTRIGEAPDVCDRTIISCTVRRFHN